MAYKHLRILSLLIILFFFFLFSKGQVVQIKDYDVSGTYTYTVPAGINELVIECWGGGGGGSASIGIVNGTHAGAGGGGGAHAHSVIKVTPGQVFTYTIGKGGAGGSNPWTLAEGYGKNGGNTTFGTTSETMIIAGGGTGATFNYWNNGGSKGGQGGTAAGSKGDVIHIGGNGGDAGADFSGGGGGAGGRTHSGYNAVGMTAGMSGTCYCGIPGAGGQGLQGVSAVGNNGIDTINTARGVKRASGGGGGGLNITSGSVSNGGKGADGHIRIKEQQTLAPITGTDYTEVGQTTQLGHPTSGGIWTSANVEIATVDATGLVTGVTPGNVIIRYAMGSFNTDQSTQLSITVYPSGGSIAIQGSRTYCENGSNQIELEASGPESVTWFWTGPNNFRLGGAHISFPPTSANAGSYTVTATDTTGGNDLIVNGNFDAENSDFSSDYIYNLYTQSSGQYNIRKEPFTCCGFTGCSDETNTGNYFMLQGNNTAETIWKQTVTPASNTSYQFSYRMQAMQVYSQDNSFDIKIQAQIAGVDIGEVFSKTTNKICNGWIEFAYNWYSELSTPVEIKLVLIGNLSDQYMVGLDDISFKQIAAGEDAIVSASINIEVGTNFTPEVTIVSHPSPAIAGESIIFTASPTHGGRAPSYKWFVNSTEIPDNTTGIFTSSVLQEGDIVTAKLIPDLTCVTSTLVTSNEIKVISEMTNQNYWHGTQSIRWDVVDNWTEKKVPSEGEDVEFATSENYSSVAQRDLELRASCCIGSYTNLTDKKLIVAPGAALTINDTVNTGGKNRILIQASDSTANGSLILLSETEPVLASVEMWAKGWIGTETNVNEKYRWQFFGIPVQSVAASPTFNGAYVRKYNEAKQTSMPGQQWESLEESSIMSPFEGYEITQPSPRKYTISGTLVKTDFSKILPVSNNSYYRGQHILANPYTAAIKISKINFGEGLDKTVYIYNTGSFADWANEPGDSGKTVVNKDAEAAPGQYTAIPQNQSFILGEEIPSMQGFLIKVLNPENPTQFTGEQRTLSFQYADTVLTPNSTKQRSLKMENRDKQKAYMAVTLSSANYADKAWLFVEEECTSSFDNGWDGLKISNSGLSAEFYVAESDGRKYQVSSKDDINNTYLAFNPGLRDAEYTLAFSSFNISEHYNKIYLLDIETYTVTDITNNNATYRFNSGSTNLEKRFKIITNSVSDDNSDIKVFEENGTLYLHNFGATTKDVILYDMTGRYIKTIRAIANSISLGASALPQGVYIISYTSENLTIKNIKTRI